MVSSWPPPPPPPPGCSHNKNGETGSQRIPDGAQQPDRASQAPPPPHNGPKHQATTNSSSQTTESFAAMRLGQQPAQALPLRHTPTQTGALFPPPPRRGLSIPHNPSSGGTGTDTRTVASTSGGVSSVQPPPSRSKVPSPQHYPVGSSPFPPPPQSKYASFPRASNQVRGPMVSSQPPPTPAMSHHQQYHSPTPPPPPVYGSTTSTTTAPTTTRHSSFPTASPGAPRPSYPAPPPPSTVRPSPYPQTTTPQPLAPPPTSTNGPPHPQRPRIDPSQIPRPPLFTRPQGGPAPVYYTRRELNGLPPPDADSRFLSCDDGNAAPQLMRSSVYEMPTDRGVWRKTGLCELGLLCTPLALASVDHVQRLRNMPKDQPAEQESSPWRDPMQVPVDFSTLENGGPPRCTRCQTYANPFWNETTCNFCGHRNRNAVSSPMALNYGTLEYAVGGPYVTRQRPVEPIFLYAVDATCPNVAAYVPLLQKVGVSYAQHVRRQTTPYNKPPRIGVCLVAAFGVVLISSRDGGVTIMPDVTVEPFCPLPLQEWTQDISTDEGLEEWMNLTNGLLESWKPFLDSLEQPSAYGQSSHALSCGGAALAFLADALTETGGRGTWVSWRRPNFGIGAIRDREAHKMQMYTKEVLERTLYMPLQLQADEKDKKVGDFYRTLGETCAKNRVTLDVMIHTVISPVAFLDVGTLGELCRVTSGKFKWVRSPDWQEPMLEEWRRPPLSFSGGDAVFKVRCSDGMRVKSFLSGTAPGVTVENALSDSMELELSSVMPDTSIAVLLEHKLGGLPQNTPAMYYQSAVLYTAPSGQRRVRVSTLGLRTSSSPADVFRSVDFATTTALLTREAIARIWKPLDDVALHLKAARGEMMRFCVDALACYRRNTQAHSLPPGQLVLPDRLQLLPLFVMSALKSTMFRPSLPKRGSGYRATHPSPTADERSFALLYGAFLSAAMSMLAVHPNVFPLVQLEESAGEWETPDMTRARSDMEVAACSMYVHLPQSTHPSIASLDESGVYAIDDGFMIYVYFGVNVDVLVRDEVLVTGENGNILSDQSEAGRRIIRLVWQMRAFSSVGHGSESDSRPTYPPVVIVLAREGHQDPYEELIMNSFVDDPTSSEQNYPEFLCDLHKHVRQQVDTGVEFKPT